MMSLTPHHEFIAAGRLAHPAGVFAPTLFSPQASRHQSLTGMPENGWLVQPDGFMIQQLLYGPVGTVGVGADVGMVGAAVVGAAVGMVGAAVVGVAVGAAVEGAAVGALVGTLKWVSTLVVPHQALMAPPRAAQPEGVLAFWLASPHKSRIHVATGAAAGWLLQPVGQKSQQLLAGDGGAGGGETKCA